MAVICKPICSLLSASNYMIVRITRYKGPGLYPLLERTRCLGLLLLLDRRKVMSYRVQLPQRLLSRQSRMHELGYSMMDVTSTV